MTFNLFLTTDLRDTNNSCCQLAVNTALSPYRFFFGGRIIRYVDLENLNFKTEDLSPIVRSHSKNWICTAVVIALIALPTFVGLFIKGLHYCISPTTKEKYRLVAFSTQCEQWKEAVKTDHTKKLEDFITVTDEERDVFLRFLLKIVNKEPDKKESLAPLLKELLSKPFSTDLNYVQAEEYFARFTPLWEEIKTFLIISKKAGTEKEDLAMIADSLAEDQAQGALKAFYLSTRVFDPLKNSYDFFIKIAEKLSEVQRNELTHLIHHFSHHGFDFGLYEVSIFPYLTQEDRLKYLERICQYDLFPFALGKGDDPYKIWVTSEEVTMFLEQTRLSEKRLKNQSFLTLALQTDSASAFPFFQALKPLSAWNVFTNQSKDVKALCAEEMKKKVQTLPTPKLSNLVSTSNQIQLFHYWMTETQLQSLLESLDQYSKSKFFESLLVNLPNDVAIIQRFLLSLNEWQLNTVQYNLFNIPFYVSRQFFTLLNLDKPLPNRLNLIDRLNRIEGELNTVMHHFFYSLPKKDPTGSKLKQWLPLIISSISPKIIPYLWKSLHEIFCSKSWIGHHQIGSSLLKRICSYESFKLWKECNIENKGMKEFYQLMPKFKQDKLKMELALWKRFQRFYIILEEFLSYRPFQKPILDHESDVKEKEILEQIFPLLKPKMPSLKKICAEVLREHHIPYKELDLPTDVVEIINFNTSPDQNYRIKMASLDKATKEAVRAESMDEKGRLLLFYRIVQDQEQGVLKLWWLGTLDLNQSPFTFVIFVRRIVEKFSLAQKKELSHFYRTYPCNNEIFALAIHSSLQEEERLLCLEQICQRDGLHFNVHVDNHCRFSNDESLCNIYLTSVEVVRILKRLAKRYGSEDLSKIDNNNFKDINGGLKDINRGFLAAALQTDFKRAFPFFEQADAVIAFDVYNYFNSDDSCWKPCHEEMKEKVQSLSPEFLKELLEKTDPKYYPLLHTWLSAEQVKDLLRVLDGVQPHILKNFIISLPNDPVIVKQFVSVLSLSSRYKNILEHVTEVPYYLGSQILLECYVSKLSNSFGDQFLARLNSKYISHFCVESNETFFHHHLPLLLPSISRSLFLRIWKGIQWKMKIFIFNSSCNLTEEQQKIIERIFSYESFKQWLILNKSETPTSFKKIIPESVPFSPFFEDRHWNEFNIFCMCMEQFLRYKPFQGLAKEAAEEKDKIVLQQIFDLLKVRSLVEICIDAIRDQKIPYLNEQTDTPLPQELIEQLNFAHARLK